MVHHDKRAYSEGINYVIGRVKSVKDLQSFMNIEKHSAVFLRGVHTNPNDIVHGEIYMLCARISSNDKYHLATGCLFTEYVLLITLKADGSQLIMIKHNLFDLDEHEHEDKIKARARLTNGIELEDLFRLELL